MDDKTRRYYKEKILDRIESTEKDIKTLSDEIKPIAPDCSIGRLTRMEAINAKSVNEKLLGNKKVKLTKLQYALKRVDTEEFGLCAVCEDEIEPNRLNLLPESVTCIACAEDQ